MANLFAWLLVAVGPLLKRALISLGIGWVTYAGLSTLVDGVRDHVISLYGQMGGSTLEIMNMVGAGESAGIILGAFAARAALEAGKKLGKLSG